MKRGRRRLKMLLETEEQKREIILRWTSWETQTISYWSCRSWRSCCQCRVPHHPASRLPWTKHRSSGCQLQWTVKTNYFISDWVWLIFEPRMSFETACLFWIIYSKMFYFEGLDSSMVKEEIFPELDIFSCIDGFSVILSSSGDVIYVSDKNITFIDFLS